MKTIDLKELKSLYQSEVDDAYMRTIDMINGGNISNDPFDERYVTALEWNNSINGQLNGFDEWMDKASEQAQLENAIIGHKTNDKDFWNIARSDMNSLRNKKSNKKHNKREREIRKVMRDDAMKQLSIAYPFTDLNDDEQVKQIWLNCKVQVRNDINTLMENIGILREVEKYIQLSNNYNQNKKVRSANTANSAKCSHHSLHSD